MEGTEQIDIPSNETRIGDYDELRKQIAAWDSYIRKKASFYWGDDLGEDIWNDTVIAMLTRQIPAEITNYPGFFMRCCTNTFRDKWNNVYKRQHDIDIANCYDYSELDYSDKDQLEKVLKFLDEKVEFRRAQIFKMAVAGYPYKEIAKKYQSKEIYCRKIVFKVRERLRTVFGNESERNERKRRQATKARIKAAKEICS